MAKADSLIVNDNTNIKNTKLLDQFINPHIFENNLIKYNNKLVRLSSKIEINERYDYRPDLLSYEVYGDDFFFPAILAANGVGSILQFKAEFLNYNCYVPSIEVIQEMFDIENKILKPSAIVDEIFAGIDEKIAKFKEKENS